MLTRPLTRIKVIRFLTNHGETRGHLRQVTTPSDADMNTSEI